MTKRGRLRSVEMTKKSRDDKEETEAATVFRFSILTEQRTVPRPI